MVNEVLEFESYVHVLESKLHQAMEERKTLLLRTSNTDELKKLNQTYIKMFKDLQSKFKSQKKNLEDERKQNEKLEERLSGMKGGGGNDDKEKELTRRMDKLRVELDKARAKLKQSQVEEDVLPPPPPRNMDVYASSPHQDMNPPPMYPRDRQTDSFHNSRSRPMESSQEERKDCLMHAFEFNTDRQGGEDYFDKGTSSARKCKLLCLRDPSCLSWVFVKDTLRCFLKAGDSVAFSSKCCISGIRCGT